MSEYKKLFAKDVKVGDKLEILSVDVTATTIVTGALASRDWRPMHHDKDFAQNQGVKNIFLNTPNQAAWYERYLTDWTGPLGRPGRLIFKMKASVLPGDTMVFNAEVTEITPDPERGICWVDLSVPLTVGEKLVTDCAARIAIPMGDGDNPWKLRGDDWKPRD
jgi:acyl dehydratase